MSGPAGKGPAGPTWVPAGHVGRAHGLDGSFYVRAPRARLLVSGGRLRVAGDETEIARRAGTDDAPIVRLAGHEGRGAAEALRGQTLEAPAEALQPLGEDEWYAEQLVGCRVGDGEQAVGTVAGLLALPSCEALQVERAQGGELLVPLVRDAVRAVDVGARKIDVDLRFLGEAE